MRVRLQRYLAQAGVASRRRSEDLIAAGLVEVNGRTVTAAGTTVDPGTDEVRLRGRRVAPAMPAPHRAAALVLHKPPRTLTTRSDPQGRRTVFDLVEPPESGRWVAVGRLDQDTEGVLLMTTSGELAHRLTHPRWGVERIYRAEVEGRLDERRLATGQSRGLVLGDGRTGPYRARVLERRTGRASERRVVEIEIAEGRNREVRRMIRACRADVTRLVRIRYASIGLGDLAPGASRRLDPDEVQRLCERVGLGRGPGGRRGTDGHRRA